MTGYKKLLAYGVAVAILIIAPTAHALTADQIKSQIQSLTQLLALVEAQISASQQGQASPPSIGSCGFSFVQNLGVGSNDSISGGAVSMLQQFLEQAGFYQYPSITGYYGTVTAQAVGAWQIAHGIASPGDGGYGSFGPRSRAYVAANCTGTSVGTGSIGQSCQIGSVQVPNGSYAQFYSIVAAPVGATCASYAQTRQCVNGIFSGNASYQYPSCVAAPTGQACLIGGLSLQDGQSLLFYSQTTVGNNMTCTPYTQIRTCSNGLLSGDDQHIYLSCTPAATASCALNGATVQNGATANFYAASTAPFGSTCIAVPRTCNNGLLSGDTGYVYPSCTASLGLSCMLDQTTLASDASAAFFASSSVPYGSSCNAISQIRSCTNGSLSGSSAYHLSNCTVASPLSCKLGGITLLSGSSSVFYFQSVIPNKEQCASYAQTRTCSNGLLSGNAAYQFASCAPTSATSCVLDNNVLPNGSSAVAYSVSAAPAGKLCSAYAISRKCTNGTLSGAAANVYSTCTNTASCTLDSVTVLNAKSSLFYSAQTVPFGSTCAAVSQSRTCINGAFSGSTTYKYSFCSVSPH